LKEEKLFDASPGIAYRLSKRKYDEKIHNIFVRRRNNQPCVEDVYES